MAFVAMTRTVYSVPSVRPVIASLYRSPAEVDCSAPLDLNPRRFDPLDGPRLQILEAGSLFLLIPVTYPEVSTLIATSQFLWQTPPNHFSPIAS